MCTNWRHWRDPDISGTAHDSRLVGLRGGPFRPRPNRVPCRLVRRWACEQGGKCRQHASRRLVRRRKALHVSFQRLCTLAKLSWEPTISGRFAQKLHHVASQLLQLPPTGTTTPRVIDEFHALQFRGGALAALRLLWRLQFLWRLQLLVVQSVQVFGQLTEQL